MAGYQSFAKLINHGQESRDKIYAGVKVLADLVSSTLGPGGRLICIHRPMDVPFLTKDGVTVAKEVFLLDEFEDAGAQMVKDASSRTCDEAGDGTTTSAVLAHSMFKQGIDAVKAGANPVMLKKGMDAAVAEATEYLKSIATKVSGEEIRKVATISANGDEEMASLVAEAVIAAGSDGVVSITESHSTETKISRTDGVQLNSGWISPYFVTDQKTGEAVLEKPYILLIDKKLQTIVDMLPFLQKIQEQGRPILIVAEDVSGEALAILAHNKAAGRFISCAIRTPGYKEAGREILEDIAAITGATVIGDELGMKLSSIGFEHLGQAKTVRVSQTITSILDGKVNVARLSDRMEDIRKAESRESDQAQRERIRMRLSRLSGGIVVIQIGGVTPLEVEEKKYRAEDAMHAVRAAMEEGIVPGGGVALIKASHSIKLSVLPEEFNDISKGRQIVYLAMLEPIQKIALNAGFNPQEVCDKVRASTEPSFGFNALTGEYGDLVAAGVIDPVKVVLSALRNAESIASVMLLTEGQIVHPTVKS